MDPAIFDQDIEDRKYRLASLAESVIAALRHASNRLVLAESCTGGIVASVLTDVPGSSNHVCGSAVVYRYATKTEWLAVEPTAIARDTAVNEQVAQQMAEGVLTRTSESTIAAAVTGHLGPDAPPALDGIVVIGLAHRGRTTHTSKHQLQTSTRSDRKIEAASLVLETILRHLKSQSQE